MMAKRPTTGAERTPPAQTGSERSPTPNIPNTPNTDRELISPSAAESNAEACRRGAAHIIRRQLIHRFGRLPEKNEQQLGAAPLEQLEALGLRAVTARSLQAVFSAADDPAAQPASPAASRYARLAREGGWIVIGQCASIAGSLVLVRLLTERLAPAEYGQLALGLTVSTLIGQTVMGGVGNGISRFYSIASEKGDLPGYLKASRRLLGHATVAVFAIGAVILAGLKLAGYPEWAPLAGAALLLSLLNGYNSSLSGIQNAARQRAIVAFHSGLDAWMRIGFVLILLHWFATSSTIVILGYAASSVLTTTSQLIFLQRIRSGVAHASAVGNRWFREMWSYSWPFSAFGIFTWAQISSDRWALQYSGTTEEVGLFAALYQLGYTPISLLTGMAVSFLGPILFQRSGDASSNTRNADVRRLTIRIALLCGAVTVVGFLTAYGIHDWLFALLVAEDYRGVSYLLPWIVVAGGLFATGQMLAIKMMSDLQSRSMAVVKIVTALLGILINVYGASIAGIKGIVVAAVSYSTIYVLCMGALSCGHGDQTGNGFVR